MFGSLGQQGVYTTPVALVFRKVAFKVKKQQVAMALLIPVERRRSSVHSVARSVNSIKSFQWTVAEGWEKTETVWHQASESGLTSQGLAQCEGHGNLSRCSIQVVAWDSLPSHFLDMQGYNLHTHWRGYQNVARGNKHIPLGKFQSSPTPREPLFCRVHLSMVGDQLCKTMDFINWL